jgi:aminoglycoside phosphotransferase (APT) family kinase protein
MGKVLAALHSVDPAAGSLQDFGRMENCNQRQVQADTLPTKFKLMNIMIHV